MIRATLPADSPTIIELARATGVFKPMEITALGEVLDALEKDHEWLLRGDVFTRDVVETWIKYKRERELAPVSLRPVPYEFFLYFDL